MYCQLNNLDEDALTSSIYPSCQEAASSTVLQPVPTDPQPLCPPLCHPKIDDPDQHSLEVLPATRTQPQIIYHGNLFNQKKIYKNGRIYYRCSRNPSSSGSCPATITTDKERSRKISSTGDHNHSPPEPAQLESLRTRVKVAQTSKTSLKTFDVLAEELGLQKTNALKQLHWRNRRRLRMNSISSVVENA